jgi:hypothetical protein
MEIMSLLKTDFCFKLITSVDHSGRRGVYRFDWQNIDILGSNSIQGMYVHVCSFSVLLLSIIGSGLVMGRLSVQGIF